MRIKGGLVFDINEGFADRDVLTNGEYISEISGDDIIIDARNCYVIPGLIDTHLHGALGEDISDGSFDGFKKIAEFELSEGVTHICPSGMTVSEKELEKICETAAEYRKSSVPGAELLGIHLEGPFVSMAKKGAQNGEYVRRPDIELLKRLNKIAEGAVKKVTLAPEEEGGTDFVKQAVRDNICVSLGHSSASYTVAKEAFNAGATHVTHLFNAMPPFHHRDTGIIGAAFDSAKVYAEVICDGIHVHESAIRASFRLFGANRMILISDSLRATGMPDGIYPFSGQKIELRGGRATMEGHPETLAGSVTSLMGCVRKAAEFGIPLSDAVQAASYNPAKALKLDHRLGSLDIDKEASIVLLNKNDLSLRSVIFKGKLV
ncbi:MAG: N-acetylglucosamine-6-phosphate deacetylase [Ruminococcaceae bacterium]|nr:N-acetylglucosamine-6-phosphate deacetylase [Oscillospiraceae bacterium]